MLDSFWLQKRAWPMAVGSQAQMSEDRAMARELQMLLGHKDECIEMPTMPLNRMSLDPLSPGSEHICMSQGWSDDERAEVVWPPAGADPPAGTMPASGGCASVDVGLSPGEADLPAEVGITGGIHQWPWLRAPSKGVAKRTSVDVGFLPGGADLQAVERNMPAPGGMQQWWGVPCNGLAARTAFLSPPRSSRPFGTAGDPPPLSVGTVQRGAVLGGAGPLGVVPPLGAPDRLQADRQLEDDHEELHALGQGSMGMKTGSFRGLAPPLPSPASCGEAGQGKETPAQPIDRIEHQVLLRLAGCPRCRVQEGCAPSCWKEEPSFEVGFGTENP